RATVTLFGTAIFAGAALLFAVEPMVAKMLLPYFGGTAAVWAVSLVFFQAALLGGYAFAHYSVQVAGVRRQVLLPLALLLPALPSSLILGTTNYISTDIAAVPLLWVIPLALYLLSFVVAFARRQPLSVRAMSWAVAGSSLLLGASILPIAKPPVWAAMGIHAA